jgi:hypothetical protein
MGTQNMNQFKKTAVVGQIDLKAGGLDSVFTVRFNPNSSKTSGIIAGEGVKLVDLGASDNNGVPIVDILSADTEVPFGARVFDHKKGTILPGEIFQVSYKGVVQWMEASAALNRGVGVALVQATPGTIQAVGSNAQYGITLDKAAAAGDVIRVLVDTAAATT